MPNRSRKRGPKPPDPAELTFRIIQKVSGETTPEPDPNAGKDPAAVSLGRRGGLIGGKVRAANMTKKQRSAAAKRAARARWMKS